MKSPTGKTDKSGVTIFKRFLEESGARLGIDPVEWSRFVTKAMRMVRSLAGQVENPADRVMKITSSHSLESMNGTVQMTKGMSEKADDDLRGHSQ